MLCCNKSEPERGAASSAQTVGDARPAAPPDRVACSVDGDCTISGRVFSGDEACCVSPCLTEAVNAEALQAFASACEGKFTLSECTRHHCAPPPPTLARCIDNECTQVEGPTVTTDCNADDDCVPIDIGVRGDSLCCSRCPDRAGNADSLGAYKAWCAEQPLDEPCPEAECSPSDAVPACVSGQCVMRER